MTAEVLDFNAIKVELSSKLTSERVHKFVADFTAFLEGQDLTQGDYLAGQFVMLTSVLRGEIGTRNAFAFINVFAAMLIFYHELRFKQLLEGKVDNLEQKYLLNEEAANPGQPN